MMTERTKSDLYYLDRIHAPILLHPDNTVGELEEHKYVSEQRVPGRIAGHEHSKPVVTSALAQVALYETLGTYLAVHRERVMLQRNGARADDVWNMDEMPAETLAEFAAWQESLSPFDIDAIHAAAVKQAALERDENATYHCRYCKDDSKYACYMCGFARRIYRYPIVTYRRGNEVAEMPFDVASVIAQNPDTLQTSIVTRFNDNGMLFASRQLVFDVRNITDESGQPMVIDAAEELGAQRAWAIDHFAERAFRDETKKRPSPRSNDSETAFSDEMKKSPEACLEALQQHVALDLYHERATAMDDQEKLDELRRRLARSGFGMMSRWVYAGMGDTDVEIRAARVSDDGLLTGRTLTRSGSDIESAVEIALKRMDEQQS